MIPFHLADPAGILFFGNAFTLFHQAYEAWIVEYLSTWNEWFKNDQWVVPIRSAEANYHTPLFAGNLCNIEIEVTSIGTSSFQLKTVFDKTSCIIKTSHVFCDKKTQKKMEIPHSFKALLKELVY